MVAKKAGLNFLKVTKKHWLKLPHIPGKTLMNYQVHTELNE